LVHEANFWAKIEIEDPKVDHQQTLLNNESMYYFVPTILHLHMKICHEYEYL